MNNCCGSRQSGDI